MIFFYLWEQIYKYFGLASWLENLEIIHGGDSGLYFLINLGIINFH